jgi:hypothetical protein
LTFSLNFQTFHKFIHSPDEAEFPLQWYQCTGVCQSYEPFHGTIRCTTVPDESHTFWRGHEDVCGGQFFKIFEMSRTNSETQQEEKKYARNVRYMIPKTRQEHGKKLQTKIQPRELFDLTDDADEGAVGQNLCDVINLDDSEYNLEVPDEPNSKLTSNFIKQSATTFNKCAFCEVIIGSIRLAQHFDKCRGFQQKVKFNVHRAITRGTIPK